MLFSLLLVYIEPMSSFFKIHLNMKKNTTFKLDSLHLFFFYSLLLSEKHLQKQKIMIILLYITD